MLYSCYLTMKRTLHITSIIFYVVIILFILIFLSYKGYSYYNLPLEERFYNPLHDWFKPSGVLGHGLGIIGTLMILFGVVVYIAAKRRGFLSKYIRLKYLLEFHIFLCTLGPVLILFHTAFKFGGIVSIAFWSMVAIVLSGIVGRFIYVQIPRTIEGRELTLKELQQMKTGMTDVLSNKFQLKDEVLEAVSALINEQNKHSRKTTIRNLKKLLNSNNIPSKGHKPIIKTVKGEISLSGKIARLQNMQKLFKYWHVAHLPFALIMLIIVIIHVVITLVFGYKWIF
jgi:hypothetical protein